MRHCPLAQEFFRLPGIQGLREEVALPEFATQLVEVINLPGRFNAFCNHVQFQLLRQQDDQLHRLKDAAVQQHTADQRPVNLQCPCRKLPQSAERRNPCSKITEDHAHSETLQV